MFCHISKITILILLLQSFPGAVACLDLNPRQEPADENATFPSFVTGGDEPSDPATTGYFINHLCIIAKNVTASVEFYTQAFGLRHIFTMQVSEHFSITYMGHSHGGRNGTGYQTVEEMNRQKNNVEGLLEIIGIDVPEYNFSAWKSPSKFSHIGMVVPDITQTQKRLEKMGAKILKNTGDPQTVEALAYFASLAPKLDPVETSQIAMTMNQSNTPLIVVEDPDGIVIEVQAQEGSELLA